MIAQTWLPQVAPFLMSSAFLAEPGAVATGQTLYLNSRHPVVVIVVEYRANRLNGVQRTGRQVCFLNGNASRCCYCGGVSGEPIEWRSTHRPQVCFLNGNAPRCCCCCCCG